MVYWLFLILVVGICVAGTGILAILIEIKVIELYKKNCWDVITLLMILTSTAVIIYFGEAIKKHFRKSSIAFRTFSGSISWNQMLFEKSVRYQAILVKNMLKNV